MHDVSPAQGLNGEVAYRVLTSDERGRGAVDVNADGIVTLSRRLNREGGDGDALVARVVAEDRGSPPLSATATLAIAIKDVNDCPPVLLPPTTFHVMENSPPTLLGRLSATDPDAWALGHGPPFAMTLDRSNAPYVRQHVALEFSSGEASVDASSVLLWCSGTSVRIFVCLYICVWDEREFTHICVISMS